LGIARVQPIRFSVNEAGEMYPHPPVGPLRVLVVDDYRDAADSLHTLLALWGHRPLTAYDPATALALAARQRPDVVLLELRLPGTDGWELARRLRSLPGLGAVGLVAVTGLGREVDRERSAAAGIDHHLVKPVEPALLEQVLADYQLRRVERSLAGPAVATGESRCQQPALLTA
jgi:CheY-like chemotaxis protein